MTQRSNASEDTSGRADGPVRLTPETTGPLSPARAFVVQFRERAAAPGHSFAGRVEHVITGHAARFESAEELAAFFNRILGAEQTKHSEKG